MSETIIPSADDKMRFSNTLLLQMDMFRLKLNNKTDGIICACNCCMQFWHISDVVSGMLSKHFAQLHPKQRVQLQQKAIANQQFGMRFNTNVAQRPVKVIRYIWQASLEVLTLCQLKR